MSRPFKVYFASLFGSLAFVMVAYWVADKLGFFGGWPSTPKFLLGAALGWQCQRLASWMERQAKGRELA